MQKRSLLFSGFIALIAWFGIGVQFYNLVHHAAANGFTKLEAIGRFFSYFTILSNLMAALSLSVSLLVPATGPGRFFKKPFVLTAIAVYIFMVGVGYNLLLRGTWNPQGWHKVSDEMVHVADPLLFALYWYFFVPKNSLKWKYALYWISVPALYLVYMIIRGAIDGFYPYSFLDVSKLGYTRMLLNALGVGIGFLAAGLSFIAIGRSQKKILT